MKLRLVMAGSMIVLLAACGGSSGTRPTLPPDASIVRPTSPPGTDAATPPAATQPAATQPAETQPAETQPAETQPAAQPEPTAAPGTAPSDTVASGGDDDGTVWWPWLLGALIVIGVIAAIASRRHRGPSWQIQTTTLLDEIEQLTSHLVAVSPGGLHAVAQSDAMRLATMRATLRDLVASAPDANSQTALNGLTIPVAELHGAVDAIAMSPDPSFQSPGASVSQLATQLHTAATSVRAGLALHP